MGERGLRTALVAIGVFHLLTGAMALIAPGTFFDDIGRYGVANEHYVGDVGAFYTAAGVVTLLAVRHASWRVPLLALTAFWYGLHAVNHLFDIDEARSDTRGLADTILLALGAALAAYLAQVAARLDPR